MKDELLIKFIDGKTTPEETEFVLNELSRDDAAAKEWLQMVQAARLVDTEPLKKISSDDFIAKTLAEKKKPAKVVKLPWIIGTIVSIAASLAIVALVFYGKDDSKQYEDVLAEQVAPVTPEEQQSELDAVEEIQVTQPQTQPEVKQDVKTESSPKAESVKEETVEELVGAKIQKDDNVSTAAVASVENSFFEMLKPLKSPYRIQVKNPEKEFVFEWKMGDVRSVRLSISDRNGNLILDKSLSSENSYGIVASELTDKGELDWCVAVTFNNGATAEKSGKIELCTVKE